MITKICRRLAPNILAVGMCVFAGSVMALDIDRALKQMQQLEPKIEKAMVPDFVETAAPLEIKGIKIGMSLKEFLAIFPQAKVANTVQNTEDRVNPHLADTHSIVANTTKHTVHTADWFRGDAYGRLPDCQWGDKKCKDLTLIGKKSVFFGVYFLNDKLAYVVIYFDRNGVKDSRNTLFYDEILPALEEKFKAKGKSKDTNITYEFGGEGSMRVAGWKNTLTKDSLELQDNDGLYGKHLLIRMQSETYTDVVKGRIDVVNDLAAKKEAAKEQQRKQDL